MSFNNPNSLLLSQYQSKIERVLQAYDKKNHVFLLQHPDYEGDIQDYIRYGNELMILESNGVFFLQTKQRILFEQQIIAKKILAKDEEKLLLLTNVHNQLILFDLGSIEAVQIHIKGLEVQEEIKCGFIQNSSRTKLQILIGTNKGRVLTVQKYYLITKEEVVINLRERRIEAISFAFQKFLSVVTDQEILIFKEDLVPYKKISLGRQSKLMSLVNSSQNYFVLSFEEFIFFMQFRNEEIFVNKIETPFRIVSADYNENQDHIACLQQNLENFVLSYFSLAKKTFESPLHLSFRPANNGQSISVIGFGSETLIIIQKKLFRCNKLNNATFTNNHLVQTRALNHRIISKNKDPILREVQNVICSNQELKKEKMSEKTTDLSTVLTSKNLSLSQKIRTVKDIFTSNPQMLYPYTDKIINLLLTKLDETGKKIVLYLIENSNKIHMENILQLLKEKRAYVELIYLYFRMGSYHQAFVLCEEQSNVDLMIETLRRCPEDPYQFVNLFQRFIEYINKTKVVVSEEFYVFCLEKHPDLIDFVQTIPKYWLKTKVFMEHLSETLENYRLENETLSKARKIQMEEISSGIDAHYLDSNKQGQLIVRKECRVCKKLFDLQGIKSKEKEVVHFFSCSHTFHRKCVETFELLQTENKGRNCPLCRWS